MGREVIRELARCFPQLYLAPGEEGAREYPEVVLRGKTPENKELSHFRTSEDDETRVMETPAGEVRVVTLGCRADFECFLQIMGNRCVPEEIPLTQGAAFLSGVVNREIFIPKKDDLIILSTGPYSGVPAEAVGVPEEDWLSDSLTIRLYHECAHFICFKLFPDMIDVVRDEFVADAVGIIAAYGRFDRSLAELFLGIRDGEYKGGRLKNYTDDPVSLLPMIGETFDLLEETAKKHADLPPLELAIRLEEAVIR